MLKSLPGIENNRSDHRSFIFLLLALFFFSAPASSGFAQSQPQTSSVPEALGKSLDALLELADPGKNIGPDMASIGRIVDFMLAPKDRNATYTADQRGEGTSNYYEFTVDSTLRHVIDLAYNPAIPSCFATPASQEQAYWLEVDGKKQSFPDLSDEFASFSAPILVKGLEFVQNTPDTFSGAYYSYELNRALVLARYNGHRVLLSMSKQRGKSDVGKKGLVIGDDEDWNYLYTGEKGISRAGLGWVDSYMYNSESIMVYVEMNQPAPYVLCGVFKWLDAGWAGINLVKPEHIKSGVQRFVKAFKQIAESKSLPRTSELADMIRRIENLPTEQLQEQVRDYFTDLRKRYQDDSSLNREWFARLLENGYIEKMSREELESIVCREYLKYLIGKSHSFDIAFYQKTRERGAKNPG